MALSDVNSRYMTPYELRTTLSQRENKIKILEQELMKLKTDNATLSIWNVKWQKHRWNLELEQECVKVLMKSALKRKGNDSFSTNEIRILAYLCSLQGNTGNKGIKRADRHIAGIIRAMGIGKTACRTALRRLQHKKLIMARLPNDYKKEIYTLPAARELVKEIMAARQLSQPNIKTTASTKVKSENLTTINQ